MKPRLAKVIPIRPKGEFEPDPDELMEQFEGWLTEYMSYDAARAFLFSPLPSLEGLSVSEALDIGLITDARLCVMTLVTILRDAGLDIPISLSDIQAVLPAEGEVSGGPF